MIYNSFFVPGKVPTMNDLLYAKVPARAVKTTWLLDKKKGAQAAVWNKYNDIKKQWTSKVMRICSTQQLVPCNSAFFTYIIFEQTKRRDPSNIAASSIKFIEDGLVKSGILPNDGWDQVLGINSYWTHAKDKEPGVHVVMSDQPFRHYDFVIVDIIRKYTHE